MIKNKGIAAGALSGSPRGAGSSITSALANSTQGDSSAAQTLQERQARENAARKKQQAAQQIDSAKSQNGTVTASGGMALRDALGVARAPQGGGRQGGAGAGTRGKGGIVLGTGAATTIDPGLLTGTFGGADLTGETGPEQPPPSGDGGISDALATQTGLFNFGGPFEIGGYADPGIFNPAPTPAPAPAPAPSPGPAMSGGPPPGSVLDYISGNTGMGGDRAKGGMATAGNVGAGPSLADILGAGSMNRSDAASAIQNAGGQLNVGPSLAGGLPPGVISPGDGMQVLDPNAGRQMAQGGPEAVVWPGDRPSAGDQAPDPEELRDAIVNDMGRPPDEALDPGAVIQRMLEGLGQGAEALVGDLSRVYAGGQQAYDQAMSDAGYGPPSAVQGMQQILDDNPYQQSALSQQVMQNAAMMQNPEAWEQMMANRLAQQQEQARSDLNLAERRLRGSQARSGLSTGGSISNLYGLYGDQMQNAQRNIFNDVLQQQMQALNMGAGIAQGQQGLDQALRGQNVGALGQANLTDTMYGQHNYTNFGEALGGMANLAGSVLGGGAQAAGGAMSGLGGAALSILPKLLGLPL